LTGIYYWEGIFGDKEKKGRERKRMGERWREGERSIINYTG
jgi:hypothetical protein